MKIKDRKDIMKSKLIDIAEGGEGRVTTAFVFKRKDGSLHGFRVSAENIELCDFRSAKSMKKNKSDCSCSK